MPSSPPPPSSLKLRRSGSGSPPRYRRPGGRRCMSMPPGSWVYQRHGYMRLAPLTVAHGTIKSQAFMLDIYAHSDTHPAHPYKYNDPSTRDTKIPALGSSFFALSPSIAAKTYACDANGVHCPASPLLAFPQVVCYWTYYSRRLHKDSRPVLMHDNNFCRPVASSEKVTKIFAALIDATISFAGPAHHPPAGSALHWSGSWASRTQG